MKYIKWIFISIIIIILLIFIGLLILPPRVVPILMYHHIFSANEEHKLIVSPEHFEWQMEYLHKHGFNVISLGELITYYRKKEIPPDKSIVLTFDDGYDDFYANAYPVLKKYRFPATVFLIADKIETQAYLYKYQIEEMRKSGLISFGSHSNTHRILTELSPNEAYKEISESKKKLESFLGFPINYFSYPIGQFNEEIEKTVKECGYKGACATNPGSDISSDNIYALKRIKISNNDSKLLSFKLKTWDKYVSLTDWIKGKRGNAQKCAKMPEMKNEE